MKLGAFSTSRLTATGPFWMSAISASSPVVASGLACAQVRMPGVVRAESAALQTELEP